MQLLATDEKSPGHDVLAGILYLEVPVTPVVPDAVYDPGRPEGDPHHLRDPDQESGQPAEQQDVDG